MPIGGHGQAPVCHACIKLRERVLDVGRQVRKRWALRHGLKRTAGTGCQRHCGAGLVLCLECAHRGLTWPSLPVHPAVGARAVGCGGHCVLPGADRYVTVPILRAGEPGAIGQPADTGDDPAAADRRESPETGRPERQESPPAPCPAIMPAPISRTGPVSRAGPAAVRRPAPTRAQALIAALLPGPGHLKPFHLAGALQRPPQPSTVLTSGERCAAMYLRWRPRLCLSAA